jgi:hypothetical protein
LKAAVISSFDHPPHYGDFADPVPNGPGQVLLEVLAAGLHQVARGRASGAHDSRIGGLPVRDLPLNWIQVGSMAGEVAAIPGAVLRSAKLQIVGSGHGSVSGRKMLKALPALVKEIVRGTFRLEVKATPLRDVEQAWAKSVHAGERIVFTP